MLADNGQLWTYVKSELRNKWQKFCKQKKYQNLLLKKYQIIHQKRERTYITVVSLGLQTETSQWELISEFS